MNTLVLPGLDGTNPLGFLAAMGALRVLSEQSGEAPRLTWRQDGTWIPQLCSLLNREELLDFLEADATICWPHDATLDLRYPKHKDKPERLAWDLKPPPPRFRAYLQQLLDEDSAKGRRAAQYAAAFAAEGVVDNNGATKPFPLHFTAGQQEFLHMAATLAGYDGKGVTREDLAEALFGPWTYSRPMPVLGWDSTVTRDYALRASNPSTDKKLGVPGADWLAFRGLAVLRSFAVGTRLVTTGCYGGWKNGGFRWPLWTRDCTIRTAEVLMNLPGLPDMRARERVARGIGCVLQSRIHRSDQGGYGNFAPSEVL
ncbi:MAG: hypothetical protein U5S82_12465 [Gammaproteobacteria bacterium]|nr:hypothetical protein [Gammaproteobacteria bacterium]